jgi:hypothetical protein
MRGPRSNSLPPLSLPPVHELAQKRKNARRVKGPLGVSASQNRPKTVKELQPPCYDRFSTFQLRTSQRGDWYQSRPELVCPRSEIFTEHGPRDALTTDACPQRETAFISWSLMLNMTHPSAARFVAPGSGHPPCVFGRSECFHPCWIRLKCAVIDRQFHRAPLLSWKPIYKI